MDIQAALRTLTEGQDLDEDQMRSVMRDVMTGECTPAQIGGLLIALRMKGETVAEIAAAASIMRELATPVKVDPATVVDVVGTGGDGVRTFNISTASAFVVAGAGGRVAKHGNRSVSSSSGAADLLEAAGVALSLEPEQIRRCIEEVGVGFMFAPMHHSAMRHAIGPRREMAVRTVFNLLGPLTNPAGAQRQLVGVFAPQWLVPIAEVLGRLGSVHALVVHSEDGLDELSLGGASKVAELKSGAVSEYTVEPEQFGLTRTPVSALIADTPAHSYEMVLSVLGNQPGPALDIVLLNAGAAIYAADLCDSLAAGVERARESVSSGAAKAKLDELAAFSNSFESAAQ